MSPMRHLTALRCAALTAPHSDCAVETSAGACGSEWAGAQRSYTTITALPKNGGRSCYPVGVMCPEVLGYTCDTPQRCAGEVPLFTKAGGSFDAMQKMAARCMGAFFAMNVMMGPVPLASCPRHVRRCTSLSSLETGSTSAMHPPPMRLPAEPMQNYAVSRDL